MNYKQIQHIQLSFFYTLLPGASKGPGSGVRLTQHASAAQKFSKQAFVAHAAVPQASSPQDTAPQAAAPHAFPPHGPFKAQTYPGQAVALGVT
nr:hypothetical protein [Paenibacillus donghaensis]